MLAGGTGEGTPAPIQTPPACPPPLPLRSRQVRAKALALVHFMGQQQGAQRTYALLTLANKLLSQCEAQVGEAGGAWLGWAGRVGMAPLAGSLVAAVAACLCLPGGARL